MSVLTLSIDQLATAHSKKMNPSQCIVGLAICYD